MKQYTIDGTIVETDLKQVETVQYRAMKPRKKPSKPQFPYLCKTAIGFRVVYAQHVHQAWAKCKNMYGNCEGTPKLVT